MAKRFFFFRERKKKYKLCFSNRRPLSSFSGICFAFTFTLFLPSVSECVFREFSPFSFLPYSFLFLVYSWCIVPFLVSLIFRLFPFALVHVSDLPTQPLWCFFIADSWPLIRFFCWCHGESHFHLARICVGQSTLQRIGPLPSCKCNIYFFTFAFLLISDLWFTCFSRFSFWLFVYVCVCVCVLFLPDDPTKCHISLSVFPFSLLLSLKRTS